MTNKLKNAKKTEDSINREIAAIIRSRPQRCIPSSAAKVAAIRNLAPLESIATKMADEP